MTWMNLAREPSSPPSLTRFTQTSPVKYYRVKAIGKGAAGESDWSNIVTVESDRSNIAAFAESSSLRCVLERRHSRRLSAA